MVREELELPIEKLFLEFEETADGGGFDRPGAPGGAPERQAGRGQGAAAGGARQIEADLALLYQAARIAKERVRALDFIDARELVDEFARSIRHELDYRQEARNAQSFHRDFAGHAHVRIPRVYWTYTRQRVLTLELLEGIQLADLEVEAYTLDERRRLAYLMTEAWMTMIFRHGFFHGDPHPANILVLGPDRMGLVDFGQAGKLSDDDMSKLTGALHRRRRGERRLARQAPRRPRRALRPGPRAAADGRASASCTTATTGHGSPRSTRSR